MPRRDMQSGPVLDPELARAYKATFSGSAGERVLKDLKEEFYDRMLFRPDLNTTVAAAAQHDVIRHILDMMGDAE